MSAHTALPWMIKADSRKNTLWTIESVIGEGGSVACIPRPTVTVGRSDANAALIVRACNAHQALVDALTAIAHESEDEMSRDCAREALALVNKP